MKKKIIIIYIYEVLNMRFLQVTKKKKMSLG